MKTGSCPSRSSTQTLKGGVAGAAGDGEVIFLLDTRLEVQVLPVGVAAHEIRDGGAVGGAAVDTVLDQAGLDLLPLLGVREFHPRVPLDGGLVREIDRDLAGLALLGGDDDDAVRGTRTVDGGRRSILQHLDGLDVIHVESDVVGGRDSVDHIQRRVVREGAGTTDEYGRETAQVTGGTHAHTGGKTRDDRK